MDMGTTRTVRGAAPVCSEREFFIDNLLVRIHFIIEMMKWTGLARWQFEFPFPGSLISTFLGWEDDHVLELVAVQRACV